jgi:hypothetical protein
MRFRVANLIVAILLFLSLTAAGQTVRGRENEDLAPNGKGSGELRGPQAAASDNAQDGQGANAAGNAATGKAARTNGISYHGGPVMLNTVNVYFIWYGNWSGNTATTILTNLAQSIGGSPYEHINTTYYNGSNQHVSGLVHYAGNTTDNYSHGKSLSDAAIQAVVANAISTHALPLDNNAVYFVLTSSDVTASSGFCTQYCGWHTHGAISGSDIKYSFVGNPDRCPSACEAQTTGPNGNAGADGMASILAHELEEAISDPDLNAWYDSRGQENADKCAWTFGTTYKASNGSSANMNLGGLNYLIQRNWVNANGGLCALSF